MNALIDFSKLEKFLTSGERIVVVIPGQEPVVLVSLAEYEKLTNVKAQPAKTREVKQTKPQAKSMVEAKTDEVEAVDPLPGALEDDDQYFPEPM